MSDAASRLGYGVPRDTSVVVNRTTKEYSFLHNEYQPGDIATCTFPTGTDYIDTRRSFLSFELNSVATADTVFSFGVHGSACNIIKSIAIFSRSGEELCRTNEFNLLKNMLLQFQYSRQWFQRQGSGMWYGSRIFNSPQTCVIPMYILSPLFAYGKLLPAALVSGMRIEITLESREHTTTGVFVAGAPPALPASGTDYFTTEMKFNLETVKLGDHIRMAMDELISTKGVELVYLGWHHTFMEQDNGFTGTTSTDITESCARGLHAYARVRALFNDEEEKENKVQPDDKRDTLRGEHIFPIHSYQWRHGDRYYPDKALGTNGSRAIIKAMHHMLNAVNQFDGAREQSYASLLGDYNMSEITEDLLGGNLNAGTGVSFDYFFPVFPGKLGCYARDGHVIGVDLTRDSDVQISGRPVNNTEPLMLTFTCNTTSSEESQESLTAIGVTPPRRIDVFLEYAKLVRVFTNSVQIEK